MSVEVVERVRLQARGRPRAPGELGAHEFQAWLASSKAAGLRVRVDADGLEAYSYRPKLRDRRLSQ